MTSESSHLSKTKRNADILCASLCPQSKRGEQAGPPGQAGAVGTRPRARVPSLRHTSSPHVSCPAKR